MLNENKFWEIIEKNKDNPLKIYDEVHDYSLEDMFGFLVILEDVENGIKDNLHLINKIESYFECVDEIILRGKEFYDIFVSRNEEKLKEILTKNPNWINCEMNIYNMYIIWALKIVEKDSEKYNKLKSFKYLSEEELKTEDKELIFNTFKEFVSVCKDSGISDLYHKKVSEESCEGTIY